MGCMEPVFQTRSATRPKTARWFLKCFLRSASRGLLRDYYSGELGQASLSTAIGKYDSEYGVERQFSTADIGRKIVALRFFLINRRSALKHWSWFLQADCGVACATKKTFVRGRKGMTPTAMATIPFANPLTEVLPAGQFSVTP